MPQTAPGSADAAAAGPTWPERAARVRRAAARLCGDLGWSPLHEVSLPNFRRADILALRPDGGFACIEVKSGARDFLVDTKWPEYLAYCDALFFAVDEMFPIDLLPAETGLIIASDGRAELIRTPAARVLPAARRRALLHRFAHLAATRLAILEDPAGWTERRAALASE